MDKLFTIIDRNTSKKRVMTIKEIYSSGVVQSNQPLPLKGKGREIEDTVAGYVIYDRRGKTYSYEGLNKWSKFWHKPMIYPVTIQINQDNTGYHYQIETKKGKKL